MDVIIATLTVQRVLNNDTSSTKFQSLFERVGMAPKFKVRADVVHYFVLVAVGSGGAYAFTRVYGETDEVKESNLRAMYPQLIKKNESQHAQMQEFFNQMKNSDKALDAKMSEVLRGGKGDMKRHYNLEKPVSPPPSPASQSPVATTAPSKVSRNDSKIASADVIAPPNTPAATNGWWNGWGWW